MSTGTPADQGPGSARTGGAARRHPGALSAETVPGTWHQPRRTEGQGGSLQVVLLYIEGCPHWRTADERLRAALVLAGRSHVRVRRRVVATPEEAEALGFRGSPSVLVDGRDPFPAPEGPAGLSCRIYSTDAGPAGSPTVDQLFEALS